MSSATATKPKAPYVRKPVTPLSPAAPYKRSRQSINNRRNLRLASTLTISFLLIIIGRELLTVATASGAYEIAELSQQVKELSRTASFMKEQTNAYNSPQNLDKMARELGMVPARGVAFMRLSDGAVLGEPNASAIYDFNRTSIPNKALDDVYADAMKQQSSLAETEPTTAPQVITNLIPAPNTH